GVELGSDGLHAEAVRVQAEDPADDLGLRLEDDPVGAVGPRRRPVAKEPAAGAAAGEGAARQPAMGLVAQVVEVELVDQAWMVIWSLAIWWLVWIPSVTATSSTPWRCRRRKRESVSTRSRESRDRSSTRMAVKGGTAARAAATRR